MRSFPTMLFLALVALGIGVGGGGASRGAEPERMPLWKGRAPVGEGRTEEADAFITVHRPAKCNGAAMVICPGGGYGGLVTGPEGHGIAAWLNRHEITGVVLEYRLPAGRSQVPLLDAQRALRTVRSRAKSWDVNPARIGIMGFSAGGHLASTAGTHFDDGNPHADEPVERVSCRPDFMILVYPVVTMGATTHQGSKTNLLGKDPSPQLVELFSNEKQVTARTPPTFLAHALDDKPVPPENSKAFYEALQKHKIPSQYLELPSGGHGLNGYKGPMWDAWQNQSLAWLAQEALTDDVRDLGSRRELFVDRFLVDRLENATLKLHEPQLAPAMTEPANNLEYGTVIKDGDLFRLYTRDGRGAKFDGDVPEVTRYCESRDGIHWTKPKLGVFAIDGDKDNNVILHEAPFCHNFSPMLDARPGVPADERFKALAGTVKSMLYAFVSGDGVHWRKLRDEPVIRYTKEYAFDSQNVSFWSESEQRYVCYFRHFLDKKLRSICRTTSTDYVTWTDPVALQPNFPGEHLYTSLTHPYFRAPHIYIATPTRFHPGRGESTDILFMTARGDRPYDRTFREAFIRPGLDPARWGNRSNYAALNVVPTGPNEMSIYATPFRRFTLRTDGFASVHAGADVGELVTRPLRFAGKTLVVNYSTSAGGSLMVELQDASGVPLPGFALADSKPLVGDAIEQPVSWSRGGDVSTLAGTPVRLRFVMREADLFALQFQSQE